MWAVAVALLFLQAADPYAAGTKALEEGRYEAAVTAFTAAVAADAKDYAAHFHLALAYSLLHRDAEGIAEYRKTLELHPGLYEAELNGGILLLRFQRFLEGYPLGRSLRLVVAISAACGLATAPIGWLQFHSVQLLTVPANALAAPAVAPLLGLALAAAAVAPFSTSAAAALAWLNGWCAAYLVAVARLVGGLPIAQVKSTRVLLVLLSGALLAAAYACPSRWQQS